MKLRIKNRYQKYIHLLLILFLISSLIFLLFYFYFSQYRKSLVDSSKYFSGVIDKENFPLLERKTLIQLGWAHRRKQHFSNSYLNFPIKKNSGVFRIGIFGCSYVEGVETADHQNLPAYLNEELKFYEGKKVEVINFGVRGYGQHQSYMLWNELGKKYNLDLTVFVVYSWHTVRDSAFHFAIQPKQTYGPVHGRYILNEGKLTYLSVYGNSRSEAANIFHRFIAPLRYWRYHAYLPTVIRSIWPYELEYKLNPLYFWNRNKLDEEIYDTYAAIYQGISHDNNPLLVVAGNNEAYDQLIKRIPSGIKILNSQINPLFKNYKTLSQAVKYHRSALAHQWEGIEIAGAIKNLGQVDFPVIKLKPLQENLNSNYSIFQPLVEQSDLGLYWNNQKIVSLAKENIPDGRFFTSRSDLVETVEPQIKSLGVLPPGDDGESSIIPIPFELPEAILSIEVEWNDKSSKLRKKIALLKSRANVLGLVKFTNPKECRLESVNSVLQLTGTTCGDGMREVKLLIGGVEWFGGVKPVDKVNTYYFRAKEGDVIELKNISSNGQFHMKLVDKKGRIHSVPIYDFVKEKKISTITMSNL